MSTAHFDQCAADLETAAEQREVAQDEREAAEREASRGTVDLGRYGTHLSIAVEPTERTGDVWICIHSGTMSGGEYISPDQAHRLGSLLIRASDAARGR